MNIFSNLVSIQNEKGAGYWILLDPDKLAQEKVAGFVSSAVASGADAFLIGGSLLTSGEFDRFVGEVKAHAGALPVVLFPGSVYQISADADAILFLSLLSGRNPQHLIGDQVLAAPRVYRSGLETISTAYMLVESGRTTSAQFMSGTTPLPANKPDIAVAHALAAQYLGFQMIYLEAGSGAERSVPEALISAISAAVDIPVIVGGGICQPDAARKKVEAGAAFVVTGTIIEQDGNPATIKAFAEAIHKK